MSKSIVSIRSQQCDRENATTQSSETVKPATCCPDNDAAPCLTCKTFARSEVDGQLEEVYERFDISELHADEDYQAWAREYNARALEAQIEADEASGPSEEDERWYLSQAAQVHNFVQKLFDLANELIESDDADLRGLGEHVAGLAHESRSLDARSWSEFSDRKDAVLDSMLP